MLDTVYTSGQGENRGSDPHVQCSIFKQLDP
jgi:hypothetical protein